jgi:methyl-accepting chemotaxis protein
MRWLHDRGTFTKLLGSFAVVCALLGFAGWEGIRTAEEIEHRLSFMGEVTVPSIQELHHTRAAVLTAQRDARGALLATDPQEVSRSVESTRAALSALDRHFARYKALPASDTEIKLTRVFDAHRDAWQTDAQAFFDGLLKNTPEGTASARVAIKQIAPKFAAANETLTQLIDENERLAGEALVVAEAAYSRALIMLAALVGAGVVFAMVIGAYIARSIAQPLQAMTRAARGLAVGDIQQEIALERQDEVGQTAAAFRDLIVYQHEISRVAEALADGDLTCEIAPTSDRDVLGLAFQRMLGNLREILGDVRVAASGVGDTAQQLNSVAGDTGKAVQQVTVAIQQVAGGAESQSVSAQSTNGAVEQLLDAIEQVAQTAQAQAATVGSTSQAAIQMASGVEQVAASAQAVASTSHETRVAAEQGAVAVRRTIVEMAEIQTVVGQATEKVEGLGRLGQRIGAVVETIDDIAEQTNLLALNAAIEAARAGEHGRGFAVVADEVRKLAERSQRETKAIGQLINEVQAGTREAVDAMADGARKVSEGSAEADRAGSSLDHILTAAQATVIQVDEIAAAAAEMAVRSRGVSESMGSMSASVEEATATAEEMAAAANEVGRSIESIADVAEENSAAAEQVSASSEEMSAQAEELSAQASELAATAQHLQDLVGRFRFSTEVRPARGRTPEPHRLGGRRARASFKAS